MIRRVLIEHGLTSPLTQYRLYGRRFYRSKDPTNSIKVVKERKEYTYNTKNNKRTDIQKTANPLVYSNIG